MRDWAWEYTCPQCMPKLPILYHQVFMPLRRPIAVSPYQHVRQHALVTAQMYTVYTAREHRQTTRSTSPRKTRALRRKTVDESNQFVLVICLLMIPYTISYRPIFLATRSKFSAFVMECNVGGCSYAYFASVKMIGKCWLIKKHKRKQWFWDFFLNLSVLLPPCTFQRCF